MKKYTNRGFKNYADIHHDYGGRVTVRESSSAEKKAVWIFIDNTESPHLQETKTSAHLTVPQARKIRDALDKFINNI